MFLLFASNVSKMCAVPLFDRFIFCHTETHPRLVLLRSPALLPIASAVHPFSSVAPSSAEKVVVLWVSPYLSLAPSLFWEHMASPTTHVVDLFVPGRVCLLGEHCDWASTYRSQSTSVPPGRCVVYGTSCGLHAEASRAVAPLVERRRHPHHSRHRRPLTALLQAIGHGDDVDAASRQPPPPLGTSRRRLYFRSVGFLDDPSLRHAGGADAADAAAGGSSAANAVGSSALPSPAQYVDGGLLIPLNHLVLAEVAATGTFYAYACGTAAVVLRMFGDRIIAADQKATTLSDHHGDGDDSTVIVDVYKVDLPMKKGLSSSAAVCVLTARAFNELFQLGLSTEDLMELAFQGELLTPSRCGRMDQCCAYGPRCVVMHFDGSSMRAQPAPLGGTFHFVVADLCAGKDTKRILADLNAAYPVASTEPHRGVHAFLGDISAIQIDKALDALARGDAPSLGRILDETQIAFRQHMVPQCPTELTSPRLYAILEHPDVRRRCLGGKGVGSQGDGSVQFVCTNAAQQEDLAQALRELGCVPFCFTLQGGATSAAADR